MSESHIFTGFKKDRILHISVIDYLQKWTVNKRAERLAKMMFMGAKGGQLSAMEPHGYGERFMRFMRFNVLL